MSVPDFTTPPTLANGGDPILLHTAAAWFGAQPFDFRPIVNRAQTHVLIFMSGMALPVREGLQVCGLLKAPVSDPFNISIEGVLLEQGRNLRTNHVYWDDDLGKYVVPYAEDGGNKLERFTYEEDGTVEDLGTYATVDGNGRDDGFAIHQGALIKRGALIEGLYSYRDGVLGIMPGNRYISNGGSGESFTKSGAADPDVVLVGTPGQYFHEDHMLSYWEEDGKYRMLLECGHPSGEAFRIVALEGDSITAAGGLSVIANPYIAADGIEGSPKRYHVATPGMVRLPNGQIVGYFSGAGEIDFPDYGNNHWDMFGFTAATTGAAATARGASAFRGALR